MGLREWVLKNLQEMEDAKKPPKKEASKAHKRVRRIMNVLLDLSPSISEISILDNDRGYKYFSVKTSLGFRTLATDGDKLIYGKGFKKEVRHIQGYGDFTDIGCVENYYTIYASPYKYEINVCPSLTNDAPFTEEEIFNSIVEIESILDKYIGLETKSEVHKKNLEQLNKRFEANE